jgi:hypothetical protein
MDGRARPPNRSFSVTPVDRLGRPISPVVLNAAEEIGRRAIEHAERLLIDPAVAAGLVEEAADTVSRALASKKHRIENDVRDLPSYLFRAFIRRVDRIRKKQLTQVDDVPVPTGGTVHRSYELGQTGSCSVHELRVAKRCRASIPRH